MARPLSADALLSALKREGVNVREYEGWRTHERDSATGKPFGPVNGIMVHHTAGADGPAGLNLVRNGRSDLPGPLAHVYIAKNGTVHLLSNGRANHAGSITQNAFDAVVAESATHPQPSGPEAIDGNDRLYGAEIANLGDGKDPYPPVQYDQAVRWTAAICRAHGWSADSVIGHKEGTRRKIDPSFDMDTFRDAVAARLAHDAAWNPGDEEDPMAGMTKRDVYDAVWKTDAITAPTTAHDRATNKTWEPQSYLKDIGNRVRSMDVRLAAQQSAIDELVRAVTELAANKTDIDPEALIARIKGEIEKVTVRLEVGE